MRRLKPRACWILVLPFMLNSCGTDNGTASPEFERVVLVTIDTLRADHLQPYGYARQTSPFIDSLASQGVLFENAAATASHTAPSHASIFTGLRPLRHRVLSNGDLLPRNLPTLAGAFRARGFQTGAFVSNSFLKRSVTGFETFNGGLRKGRKTVQLAINWIESLGSDQPFFLWVHFFDVHEAELEGAAVDKLLYKANDERLDLSPEDFYAHLAERHGLPNPPPEEAFPGIRWESWMDIRPNRLESREEIIRRIDDYDSQISYVDKRIERLSAAVENERFKGSSLWVITADHGEGLGGHYYRGHDAHIYQAQLHVPLIFFASNGSLPARRIETRVSLVDLAPTLLEVIDEPWSESDGSTLWPALRGQGSELQDRPVFAQRKRMVSRENKVFALIDGNHKYILHTEKEDEFYDLDTDPNELVNRIESPEAGAYRSRLESMLGEFDVEALMGAGSKARMPTETEEELEALGYMGDDE